MKFYCFSKYIENELTYWLFLKDPEWSVVNTIYEMKQNKVNLLINSDSYNTINLVSKLPQISCS